MRRFLLAWPMVAVSLLSAVGCRQGEPTTPASDESVVVSGLTPPATGAVPLVSSGARLRCDFEAGERLDYTLSTRASLEGDTAALGPGIPSDTGGIDQSGRQEVQLRALAVESDGSALVQFSQRGEGSDWQRALVRIAPNCAFEDIGVPPGVADAERSALVDELLALEFVGAAGADTTWTAEQHLPFGRARLAYQAAELPDGRTLVDRRVARVLDGEAAPDVYEAGRIRGWIRSGRPWLDQLELERQVMNHQGSTSALIREQVRLTPGPPPMAEPAPLDPKRVRWTGHTLRPLKGRNRTYSHQAAPPGLDRIPAEQLIARIVTGLRADTEPKLLPARKLLVYALRARKDIAAPLAEALLTGKIAGRGVGALFLGLTDAGTPQAEAALAAIVADARTTADLRRVTVLQMHRQLRPTAVTVEALTHAADSESYSERTRHSAWASLGALVGHGRLPLALEGSVRETLATAAAAPMGKPLTLTMISALGNTRHMALLDDVRRFVEPQHDATVRVHAAVVLERMGAPLSVSETLGLMQELHDVRHRDRLLRLLRTGALVVSEQDIATALPQLSLSSAPSVRLAAVHVLGRRAINAGVQQALADWYTRETDARIKRALGSHVSAVALRRSRIAARSPAPSPLQSHSEQ